MESIMGKGAGSIPETPDLEPVKSAEQAMEEASSETARAQRLRRGISSTFSRSSVGGGSAVESGSVTSSATSGTGANLGS